MSQWRGNPSCVMDPVPWWYDVTMEREPPCVMDPVPWWYDVTMETNTS